MSFTRISQLIIYTVAVLALVFVPGWDNLRLITVIPFCLMILLIIFAPRIGGQCSKCDAASAVLYNYRCAKCRKRR